MHSREQKAALELLAEDLRRIRTDSGKTLVEVHEDTRIPLEVLRRLESDLLSGDKMFNDVYLRSILRGYARTVQASDETLLSAFEEASKGIYGQGTRIVDPKPEVNLKKSDHGTGKKRKKKKAHREGTIEKSDKSASPPQGDRPASSPQTEGKERRKFVLPKFDIRKGGIGIVVLVAVATGLFAVVQILSTDGEAQTAESQNTRSEQAIIPGAPGGPASDTASVKNEVKTPFVMPDSIEVAIHSRDGVFDPIRVRVDRDLRRPYWADSSDTLYFTFRDRIIFEEQATKMNLLVSGRQYPLPSSLNNSFVLTRELSRQFLEKAE